MRLHIDTEIFSECPLKTEGLYRYAEHPTTRLLCMAFQFGDGPTMIWVPLGESIPPKIRDWASRQPCVDFTLHVPGAVRKWIHDGGEIAAHKADFEMVVLNGVAGEKLDFPRLRIEQMVCTMAKARVQNIPASLEEGALALGTFPKKSISTNNMRQLCKPRTGVEKYYEINKYPEKYIELYEYCIDDVKAEYDLDHTLPDLTPSEMQVWRLDQRINARGWKADLEYVDHALYLIAEYKTELAQKFGEITGLSPTQTEKFSDWVRARYQISDLQAETVRLAILDPNCPKDVARVLRIYSSYNAKSVSKYKAIKKMVSADGRLHGLFMYHGASTGRWSSSGVQLHNMARGIIPDPGMAIELMPDRDVPWMKTMYGGIDLMKVFGSCVRGMLIAPEGKQLLAMDFAGIESRITAWIFGEKWKLKAFEAYDAKLGPNLYSIACGRMFNIPAESVKKGTNQYMIGKVVDLASGFEGGAGAIISMAETYSVNLKEMADAAENSITSEAWDSAQWMWDKGYLHGHGLPQRTVMILDALKSMWRTQHPAVVQGWKDLKAAAIAAVEDPTTAYAIPNKMIIFKKIDRWLYMRLPSGRKIAYFEPSLSNDGKDLHYMGIDTDSRRYMKCSTFGGKLCQNFSEGIARCLLTDAMLKLEASGFLPVGSIHDEAITEVGLSASLADALKIMVDKPAWANGLPIAAEGFIAKRYRK